MPSFTKKSDKSEPVLVHKTEERGAVEDVKAEPEIKPESKPLEKETSGDDNLEDGEE